MTTMKRSERIEVFARTARKRSENFPADTGVLGRLRAAGRAAFSAAELPNPKTESWKYSRIGPLLEQGLLDRAPAGAAATAKPIPGLDVQSIAIIDGIPQSLLAAVPGIAVTAFSALTGAQAVAVETHLGRLAAVSERPFVALNAALLEDGLVIQVASGADVALPIELLLAQSDGGAPRGVHPRVLVIVGQGARATLIERHLGAAMAFTNSVVEVVLADGAQLDHLRLALDAGRGRWLSALDVELGRAARYHLWQAQLGAAFRRNEIRIQLAGEGAEVTVSGAGLTRNNAHLDNQLCLEHLVPRGTSTQVFRNIAGETSRGILNGRIHIHRGAQKTDAQLHTKSLLLSRRAEIDVKPELEIYTDDVKCAHGATLGQLDANALFYLRSRGLDETAARTMLSFAFLAEVVDSFPVSAVREALRPALAQAFAAPAEEDAP
jgi:Fe-S cluster assembly protein SufD